MARAALELTSEKNRQEHESLRQELRTLDSALAELVCFPEVYANLASAARVCECGRGLLNRVPGHFAQEEASLLADVARRGAHARTFVKEMKQEHVEIQRLLEAFGASIQEYQSTNDLDEMVCRLKQQGQDFAQRMTAHMATEESRVAALMVN